MKWRLDEGQIEIMDAQMADIFRQKSSDEKVEMIFAAHRTAKLMIAAGLRDLHPTWDEAQVQAEVSRRLLNGAK